MNIAAKPNTFFIRTSPCPTSRTIAWCRASAPCCGRSGDRLTRTGQPWPERKLGRTVPQGVACPHQCPLLRQSGRTGRGRERTPAVWPVRRVSALVQQRMDAGTSSPRPALSRGPYGNAPTGQRRPVVVRRSGGLGGLPSLGLGARCMSLQLCPASELFTLSELCRASDGDRPLTCGWSGATLGQCATAQLPGERRKPGLEIPGQLGRLVATRTGPVPVLCVLLGP
jgi:hypothetical protein